MDEKNLLKVALICSIIGVFVIFIFADKLDPSLISISDISSSFIDQSVKFEGKVTSVINNPSVSILDVKDDNGSIKVVAFDNDFELREGQVVEIFGKVTEYKGVLEVEAKKIVSKEV